MATLLAPFTGTAARTRHCGHGVQASRVALVDAEGLQIVRPLRITNLDVVEFIAAERNAGDVLAFIAADACRFTDPMSIDLVSDDELRRS